MIHSPYALRMLFLSGLPLLGYDQHTNFIRKIAYFSNQLLITKILTSSILAVASRFVYNELMSDRRGEITMKTLDVIALTLLIVGGLNWLLVGLLEFDLVAKIAGGSTTILAKVIYIVVGICAIYCLKFFPLLTNRVEL